MNTPDQRWQEKVHPLSRNATAEDPMELMAEPVPGDPAVMLECILQEFAWMGWDADQLLALFSNPGYPLLCQLCEHYGEAEIRRRIQTLIDRWGVLTFRETLAEPDEEDHLPDLVQLSPYNEQENPP